jgi:hypothetical protein
MGQVIGVLALSARLMAVGYRSGLQLLAAARLVG